MSFGRAKGAKAVAHAALICRQILDGDEKIWGRPQFDTLTERQISDAYDNNIYEQYEAEFGPYFRCLYHIFKTIDQNGPEDSKDKVYYANFARAQLSSEAVTLLAINGIHERGNDFKMLIERFGLLKHIPIDLQFTEIFTFYDKRAFMSSAEREAAQA